MQPSSILRNTTLAGSTVLTGTRRCVEDAIKHLLMLADYLTLEVQECGVAGQCGVSTIAPPLQLQKEFFNAKGPFSNSDDAKAALPQREDDSEDEPSIREIHGCSEIIQFYIHSAYHCHSVGACCDSITRIRKKRDVEIVFRYKGSVSRLQDIVMVCLENQTRSAKAEFLLIIQELEEHISKEVEIDLRVHVTLFGPRGKAIAGIQNYFNVVVHFPSDESFNKITITGMRKGVEYATRHLLMLADYS